MRSLAFLTAGFFFFAAFRGTVCAQDTGAYISPEKGGGYAIDARGVRHAERSALGNISPVYKDCIKRVAPDYPYGERAQRHVGKGFFRLELNLKSGIVTKITVAKSTGFAVLDNCALAALRQWRWRPNHWKEVEMPVIFKLERGPHQLPRGAVPIP